MNHLKGVDVEIGYDEVSLIKNFSFEFRSGQVIAILGLNGSGKTTFFKSLMGSVDLLAGNIFWNSVNMKDFSFSSRQKIFSWLPARKVIEEQLKVYELLSYSAEAVNNEEVLKSSKTMDLMNHVIALMKLEKFLEKPYLSLSEGEKKKVEIAAMFMKNAPVCLLDEPSIFLDISNQKEISGILKHFAKVENKVILFSSHDLTLVESTAEECWVVSDQKVEVFTNVQEGIHSYTNKEFVIS